MSYPSGYSEQTEEEFKYNELVAYYMAEGMNMTQAMYKACRELDGGKDEVIQEVSDSTI